jgi:hypothetical protein
MSEFVVKVVEVAQAGEGFMYEPGNVKDAQRRRTVLALMSKATALLALVLLGFLLTRSGTTLPVGWIVIAVTVIEFSLAYSPAKVERVGQHRQSLGKEQCHGQNARGGF